MSTVMAQGQVDAKEFKAANKQFKIGNYYGALKMYEKLYVQDPENKELNFYMGVCNYNGKNYGKAEEHFSKSSSSTSLELFRYRASIAHIGMKFKKASNYLEQALHSNYKNHDLLYLFDPSIKKDKTIQTLIKQYKDK